MLVIMPHRGNIYHLHFIISAGEIREQKINLYNQYYQGTLYVVSKYTTDKQERYLDGVFFFFLRHGTKIVGGGRMFYLKNKNMLGQIINVTDQIRTTVYRPRSGST